MSAGTVYLLHFDRPYKHARHYIGWAASSRSLKARQAQHGTSEGARLLAVARAAGITWQKAEHTALRHGAVTGKGPRAAERGPARADLWLDQPAGALAYGGAA